ncbi:DUF4382 domain-containing protein [Halocola ammonii]
MKSNIIIALAAVILIAAGCSKDNEDLNSTDSPTRVKIYMHDQPIDYQQVNIDLQAIELKGSGEDQFIELGEFAGIYNLLDYQNEVDTLVGDSLINFAYLSQIRLILGPENSVMVDSVLYPMQTPSAQQSGLKINVNQSLSEMDTLVVSFDFDANESVHQLGNGDYQLHPVIHLDE